MFHASPLKQKKISFLNALTLCLLFFIAYSILSVVRHNNYQSFGYDLGINNQVVWRYSQFQLPLTTSDPFPYETKLVAHVELVYALIAPFYWLWSDARMLLILDAGFLCASGIAIYLLSKKKKLSNFLSLALLIAYLAFYGVQNAVWFDVHSASFAAAFLAWFLYFLESKNNKVALLFLILAITAKENIGLLTFLISSVYFLKRKSKVYIFFMIISLLYVLFIYLIYFPYLTPHPYLYQNTNGLFSNLNPVSLIDSQEKRDAIFYSFASFGFLPFLAPLSLLPILGDLATYFVLASDLKASHGIFMHYRVTLAPLLAWATINSLTRIKKLQTPYIALYIILSTLAVQYILHLPLSYLTKSWFWTQPDSVKDINTLKQTLNSDDSLVAQNNIIPHISQRDKIYTLYPEKKEFLTNSPCDEPMCDWFRWVGEPIYLFIDTSDNWDARHFLVNRENYIQGILNLEKAGVIKKYKQQGNAILYTIEKKP